MKKVDNQGIRIITLNFIRIFLGLVFIFSSVVKGIDPMGTSYRVQDYLFSFNWGFLVPHVLLISYVVILSEFLLGIAFLFKVFFKKAIWLMFVMLSFFTVLTFFNAIYNLVSNCGCFGDAVKLSNWVTFYKNLILIALNIILLISGKRLLRRTPKIFPQVLTLLITGILFLGFMNYNLNHLPVIDFRNWKVGRDMKPVGQAKERTFVTYRNKATGETKEFLFPNYPWRDSTWMSKWKFVGQRVDNSQANNGYNLIIEDSLGNNQDSRVFENPDFQFILISFDLNLGNKAGFKEAARLFPFLKGQNISLVLLTASDWPVISKVEKEYHLKIPAYLADDVSLKAMIRSNPGLMLMKNGIILKKWHFHDFPTPGQIKKYLASLDD